MLSSCNSPRCVAKTAAPPHTPGTASEISVPQPDSIWIVDMTQPVSPQKPEKGLPALIRAATSSVFQAKGAADNVRLNAS